MRLRFWIPGLLICVSSLALLGGCPDEPGVEPTTPPPTPSPMPATPTLVPTPVETETPGPTETEAPSPTPEDLDKDDDGYVQAEDCRDDDPAVHPNAVEVAYDGVDQDCDGLDLTDVDEDGQSSEAVDGPDCDDDDASIYAGAPEVPYDTIDQDCDGEDLVDVDEDGFVAVEADGPDCDDQDANTWPGAPEYDDDRDNDCDSAIDEGLDTTDDDQDGYAESAGDCNDAVASIHPGAEEVPYDGIDQDCSGLDLTDLDGDGFSGGESGTDCDDAEQDIHPGAEELPYDGIDQDCVNGDLVDVDRDGFVASEVNGTDCHDGDLSIYPGAEEVAYDGIDQDCQDGDLVDVDHDGAIAVEAGGDDCQDEDDAIFPDATELCDEIDNNCDDIIDLDAEDRTEYFEDSDSDGFGDAGSPVLQCQWSEGLVSDSSDCDDSRANVSPTSPETCDSLDNDCDQAVDEDVKDTFYRDQDVDGYGDAQFSLLGCTMPAGYVIDATDCDDDHGDSFPGGTELCDERDNDCDGSIDEDVQSLFYLDFDQDGYGDATAPTLACTLPAGYAANDEDCSDSSPAIHPTATEVCNELDDDCNGQTDEGVTSRFFRDSDLDTYGAAQDYVDTCTQPAGYVFDQTDCDDSTDTVHPLALESCDLVDNDCDGVIDEGVTQTFYLDADGDGYGDPAKPVEACSLPVGYTVNNADCNDASSATHPGVTDDCNGTDDDCDGQVDESKPTWYLDSDGDGYGNTSVATSSCSQPGGYVSNSGDCNDGAAAIKPGATEVCDSIDNDCDLKPDDGFSAICVLYPSYYNFRTQNLHSGYPQGQVLLGGINFNIPTSGNNAWHAVNASGSNPRSIEITVDQANILEVHTLINTYWGVSGGPYAWLEFYGSSGAYYKKNLYSCSSTVDIRDYLNNTWCNSINNTTTINVSNLNSGQYRLDKQKIALPTEFASQRLTKVKVTDNGADGSQRIFIAGLSVVPK